MASKKIEGVSDSTIKNYALQLAQFQKTVIKSTNMIDVNDIRLYLAYIQKQKNLKISSVCSIITIIKGFFSFLHQEGFIEKNPTYSIKSAKYDKKKLRDSLSMEELEKLRENCKDLREKVIMEFAYCTACRAAEIVKVLDIKDNTLKVVEKGDKERIVYLSVKCRLYITGYLETRKYKSEYLFASSKAPYNPISVSGLEKLFKRIASRTDVTKSIYPHILRHTWATNALKSGMYMNIIQRILGDEHASTTQIYAKVNDSVVKHEYEKLMIS